MIRTRNVPKFPSSVYHLTANPCTSRTVSALPLDPATVENRMKIGVFFPDEPKKDAPVMFE